MAGPGIRYWEMAKALSRHFSVTLAVPGTERRFHEKVRVVRFDATGKLAGEPAMEDFAKAFLDADVLIVSGSLLEDIPALSRSAKPIVVDLYVPYLLENLEVYAH